MSKEPLRKTCFNIPASTDAKLDDIRHTKCWSMTVAIIKAIHLYHWFLQHEKSGSQVTIEVKTKEGELRRFEIPWI